jgi:sensor histidine kinase YesM
MKKSTGKTIVRVFIHVIAWLFFLSLLTSLVPKPPDMNPVLSIVIPDLLFISFFYINYYIFVPRLFVTGKYLLFRIFRGLYLAISTVIRMLFEWKAAEKEKMQAELSLLKAQINPHFLFNTLNSIYSLAVTGDNKTPEAIGLFSHLMRYVLYESNHDFIPLDKKLDYINTYRKS